jgi:hypothetical protein
MDYLSNYYKNLCEQLQERINHLEQMVEYVLPGTATHDEKGEALPAEVVERRRKRLGDLAALARKRSKEAREFTDRDIRSQREGNPANYEERERLRNRSVEAEMALKAKGVNPGIHTSVHDGGINLLDMSARENTPAKKLEDTPIQIHPVSQVSMKTRQEAENRRVELSKHRREKVRQKDTIEKNIF